MPNFVKTSGQIKKFYLQELDLDRSVCMQQVRSFLEKKERVQNFDTSKTERNSSRIYRRTNITKSSLLVPLIIYIYTL